MGEIQERARESKEANLKQNVPKGSMDPHGETEPAPKTNTAEELARLADTSPVSIKRDIKKDHTINGVVEHK